MSSALRQFGADTMIHDSRPPRRRDTRRLLEGLLEASGHPASEGAVGIRLRAFQKDLGLKPDGIIAPGGSTENAVNAPAAAGRKGGPPLVVAVKAPMRVLAREGLVWSKDPHNPGALGMWRDLHGRRVESERAGAMLRDAGYGAPGLTGGDHIFARFRRNFSCRADGYFSVANHSPERINDDTCRHERVCGGPGACAGVRAFSPHGECCRAP